MTHAVCTSHRSSCSLSARLATARGVWLPALLVAASVLGACARPAAVVHESSPVAAAPGAGDCNAGLRVAALVDIDAQHAQCSDCEPNCFRVGDSFDPADGPLTTPFAQGVQYHGSGAGLTLQPNAPLPIIAPPGSLPAGTLYLEIPQGVSASASHGTRVRPAQSDVYLLLDQSLAMAEATQWLQDQFESGALLAVGTTCGNGDASLLDRGVSGALECTIPDIELGVGMFRDLPFEPYATDTTLPAAEREADARGEIAYRNHARQTASATAVAAALATLGGVESSGTPDVAGSQIAALHSVATGEGLYTGLERASVPAAHACPGARFGYPCFRENSRPVVVLVTGAPFHDGPEPDSYPYDYDPANLTMQTGTAPDPTRIDAVNDSWQSAFALPGDVGSTLATYEGSTALLGAGIATSLVGCGAVAAAPNAVFRFNVQAPAGTRLPVTLSTEGSAFPTAVAVMAEGVSVETLPASSDNELFASAYDLGDVTHRHVAIDDAATFRTSAPLVAMSADYQGSLFGAACGANTLAPDAVYRFDVASAPDDTDVTVLVGMGGARAVVAIYEEGAGPLPRWPALTTTLVAIGNRDAASAFTLPSGPGNEYLTVRGDSTGLGADYDAAVLGSGICTPDSTSMDVAFRIEVAAMRTLRFDTEGSSFDTVLSLHDAPPTGAGAFIACDDGAAQTRASVLERELAPGEYFLVIKGKSAADRGAYQLTVRDVSALQTVELGCDDAGSPGDVAFVRFTAWPDRSYYALVKGTGALDKGGYTLHVRDDGALDQGRYGCDASSGPDGSSRLTVPLSTGDYFAVIKGRAADAAGEYRLTIGGAPPIESTFEPPGYAAAVDALQASGIRVATVLSCAPDESCEHAAAQAAQLAEDTDGTLRMAPSPADVPAEIVRAVQLVEALDRVSAELLFEPDANPGFASVGVTAVPDPNNLCSAGSDAASFLDCAAGALPSFRVSLSNPLLAPVPPPPAGDGYAFTLRITGERDGQVVLEQDVPVLAAPVPGAPAGSYDSGSYFQDFDANGCSAVTERASWDELSFDADVLPDTRVTFHACSAEREQDLATCEDGERSSGYRRVLTLSAGSGGGTPCSVDSQQTDCPNGYCSPYTGACIELEGASCLVDADCPGTAAGRCRRGVSGDELGNTCRVDDLTASPASALGVNNYRAFMRLQIELESQGDGSRAPAVFYWEARYRCRSLQ